MTQTHPVIDARDLAHLLRQDPSAVYSKMKRNLITSRCETGVGKDAGRFRVTFQDGSLRVRLTCNANGEVISTIRINTDTGTIRQSDHPPS